MASVFYDFSGGMESAAMLVVDRERIRERSKRNSSKVMRLGTVTICNSRIASIWRIGPLEKIAVQFADERQVNSCACFGGTASVADEIEAELASMDSANG